MASDTLFEGSSAYFDDPDIQLMLEFQQGNKASFEKLLVKYFPRVLNFIYRYLGNKEVAEDLTQEVFIKVFQNASSYHPTAKLQTWLFTIAKNMSLNELRRMKKPIISMEEPVRSGTTETEELTRQIEDVHAVNPHKVMVKEERTAVIRQAIESLPENQRTAVLLRRYENFSYEEIAQTMNLSVEAVKSLLNRAKVNLKESLAPLLKNL